MSIRTDLAPDERGLENAGEPVLWAMPADYPSRLKKSLENSELRRWEVSED